MANARMPVPYGVGPKTPSATAAQLTAQQHVEQTLRRWCSLPFTHSAIATANARPTHGWSRGARTPKQYPGEPARGAKGPSVFYAGLRFRLAVDPMPLRHPFPLPPQPGYRADHLPLVLWHISRCGLAWLVLPRPCLMPPRLQKSTAPLGATGCLLCGKPRTHEKVRVHIFGSSFLRSLAKAASNAAIPSSCRRVPICSMSIPASARAERTVRACARPRSMVRATQP